MPRPWVTMSPNNSGFGDKFKAGRRPEPIGETGKN